MKRFLAIVLTLVLVMMLSGCGEAPQPDATQPPTQPTETEPAVVVVSSVDELLAALAPDTQILLEAGTYELSSASDYGGETDSPYYSWEESYDGYELKLRGLNNLAIRGSGMVETVLSAQSIFANVLTLHNCNSIVLENMTLGHTPDSGSCSGGVLVLQGCLDVDMQRLGLFGCGVNGLYANVCSDITLRESDIYDCSDSGIIAKQTEGLTVENCRLYDLGNEAYGGHAVFSLTEVADVTITGCEIRDNLVHKMINGYPGEAVAFCDNRVVGNRFREMVFDLYGFSMLLEGNHFENNSIHLWYGPGMELGVDAQGEPVTEQMLEEAHIHISDEAGLPPRTQVHVATVDELLAAIAPDTEIILDEELYDLSTATNYGTERGEYYYWEDIYDGPGLVITGVDNFCISSSDGKLKKHTLAAVPRYANVITFSQCSNITLSGFTAGHTEEAGSCTGGVIMLRDCETVQVDNCGLYGCGILGVQAEYCEDISVTDCSIYECSLGGIQMYYVDGVTISGCSFRKLGGDSIMLQSCTDATVDGESVEGSWYSEE